MSPKIETKQGIPIPEGELATHPPIVALISIIGPYNIREWGSIVRSAPEEARVAAQDLIKDAALIVEGAQFGAGANFLKYLFSEPEVDLEAIAEIERTRTTVSIDQKFRKIPFALNINSFLIFGHPFAELQPEDQETALQMGAVSDLSHFSRIMQKDAARDDVRRLWQVGDVALALERNLNALSIRRGDEHFPVPAGADMEGGTDVIAHGPKGVVAVTSTRRNQPNVSFSLAISQAEAFSEVIVPSSEGRGEIIEEVKHTPKELLHYLSAQFEALLLHYPLEKAALIFDKFIYKLGLGDLNLQLTAVQSIRGGNGEAKAKVLTVGNIGVARFTQKQDELQPEIAEAVEEVMAEVSPQRSIQLAIRLKDSLGLTDKDIPQISEDEALTKKQQGQLGRLKGKIISLSKEASTNTVMLILSSSNGETGLGSFKQVAHRIIELEVNETDSFAFIPPTISQNITRGRTHVFSNPSPAFSFLSTFGSKAESYSFSAQPFITPETQVISAHPWTPELVMSQPEVADLIQRIQGLTQEFDEVFVSLQFGHIHPTLPSWTHIQEEGAQLAGILGEILTGLGTKVEGRTLIDEWHTHDIMQDITTFEAMLQNRANGTFNEVIQESSPGMRLLGDAIVRAMITDPRTQIPEGSDTLVHFTDDGRTVEVWDSAKNADGEIALGRQACVPFNTGMDIGLMDPDLTDRLFKIYLHARFPDKELTQAAQAQPHKSLHQIITDIMRDPDIAARNANRLRVLNEIERLSFSELTHTRPDLTAFDLLMLDEFYSRLQADLENKRRIPVVIHVLETNYNAQQQKAAYVWEQFGFMDIPVFRVSFDPASKRLSVLESLPPQQNRLGPFLEAHRQVIEMLRSQYLNPAT